MTKEERFRQANDYAVTQGFASGFPNFHQADHGNGVVYGTFLIKHEFVEWKDVLASELGNPSDIESRFRAVNDYAVKNEFAGGFPNFHQADYGNGVVYGVVLLKHDAVEWRDILASELGNPSDIESRFRAVNDYAVKNGFAGGFPNFHQADHGNGVVYGTFLLKHDAVEWRDVPATIMNMFSWPFDSGYTTEQRLHVLERHCFAYSRLNICSNLSEEEKGKLLNKYNQVITHKVTTDSTINGQATVGGNEIWINLGFLDARQEDEIAQTLIHEMMHCAGYSHPKRQSTDVPGDNGRYYSSAPLRAELCIAGRQSDRDDHNH